MTAVEILPQSSPELPAPHHHLTCPGTGQILLVADVWTCSLFAPVAPAWLAAVHHLHTFCTFAALLQPLQQDRDTHPRKGPLGLGH